MGVWDIYRMNRLGSVELSCMMWYTKPSPILLAKYKQVMQLPILVTLCWLTFNVIMWSKSKPMCTTNRSSGSHFQWHIHLKCLWNVNKNKHDSFSGTSYSSFIFIHTICSAFIKPELLTLSPWNTLVKSRMWTQIHSSEVALLFKCLFKHCVTAISSDYLFQNQAK